MPFGLCHAPDTFQWEINQILPPRLGLEVVIRTDIHINEDDGMVVVAYVDSILIATKGSLETHRNEVL